MYTDERIGGRHTSIVHMKKGAPPEHNRSIDKAAKELIKKGYIVLKTTGYGMQVSLNVHRIPEIEQILGMDP